MLPFSDVVVIVFIGASGHLFEAVGDAGEDACDSVSESELSSSAPVSLRRRYA